ncbi:MAG TPA: DUF1049 domain-containing protein [Betaproteobacteria bacterium]|nr:DUF1049 domain-containing protein [Betaproteobacteria bacterium]
MKAGTTVKRYLFWLLGILLFLLVLGFAVKNSGYVTVSYYLGYQWRAPLILVVLLFFALGGAVGMAASLGYVFRQKRDIRVLKRDLRRQVEKTEQGKAV